jgi:hypothetical protein
MVTSPPKLIVQGNVRQEGCAKRERKSVVGRESGADAAAGIFRVSVPFACRDRIAVRPSGANDIHLDDRAWDSLVRRSRGGLLARVESGQVPINL